jgi:hypothetical protein
LRVVSKMSAGVNASRCKPSGAVTRGADTIGTYNKTPNSYRKWCKTCGGHIFTEHPGMGLTDVYAAVIPDFPYQPGVHVHYQETRLRIKDGLPKLKDVPREMGAPVTASRNDTGRFAAAGLRLAHRRRAAGRHGIEDTKCRTSPS